MAWPEPRRHRVAPDLCHRSDGGSLFLPRGAAARASGRRELGELRGNGFRGLEGSRVAAAVSRTRTLSSHLREGPVSLLLYAHGEGQGLLRANEDDGPRWPFEHEQVETMVRPG
ncbi:hypothetical protein V501_00774 [Pseudogymnoascus sp. VKM F-4519 (FW-2642)]|nr:hypothetical protein V501_00774 [Pseudogymnoascus sp. VKM F-4519 (FW-2642)]